MSKIDPSPFIELSEYWLSDTRKDYPIRGFGKWTLSSEEPHRLYGILREELISGVLRDASSMKTKAEPSHGAKAGAVYLHTAPYTDREKVLRLAEELGELDETHKFQLVQPLIF
ncbi:MAG: hypothetical protein WBB69_06615 [Anaerolineales bacterium]